MAEPKTIIIQGEEFVAVQPYNEGHVLTSVEAKALNQLRNENLRNNFAKFVKDAKDGVEGALAADKLAEAFAKYDAGYTFASPGAAKPKMDPVEREARALAKDVLKNHLAKQNRTFKDIPAGLTAEEWEEKIEANIVKIIADPAVFKLAKENVARRAKTVQSASEGLDL